jgi:A/G-specific adenine glycosylase
VTDLRSTAETRSPTADDGQRSAVGGRWSAALLAWFAAHARPLPWRVERRDPYHVWLSETMAQQTRIAAVLPYFERWLQRFPTIAALADAPLDDVLKAWEGLGYYSRARNLHRAARRIRDELGGRFPDDVPGLLSLPGVGRYTAGAIASLAFGRHAAVVDGNVRRVFARVFALPAERSRDADLWPLAEELLPPGRAGEFNEALMELGALVCTPRNPKCSECPLREHCAAHAADAVAQFPVKKTRAATRERTILTALVRRADGRLLLGQRPHDGLLGGLWEFVGEEYDGGRGTADDAPQTADGRRQTEGVLSALLLRRTGVRVQDVSEPFGEVRHAFTHFKVRRLLHRAVASDDAIGAPDASGDYVQLRWADRTEIDALALTRSDRRIAGML